MMFEIQSQCLVGMPQQLPMFYGNTQNSKEKMTRRSTVLSKWSMEAVIVYCRTRGFLLQFQRGALHNRHIENRTS